MKNNLCFYTTTTTTRLLQTTNFIKTIESDRAILEDIGCNADLYIANQEDNTQI